MTGSGNRGGRRMEIIPPGAPGGVPQPYWDGTIGRLTTSFFERVRLRWGKERAELLRDVYSALHKAYDEKVALARAINTYDHIKELIEDDNAQRRHRLAMNGIDREIEFYEKQRQLDRAIRKAGKSAQKLDEFYNPPQPRPALPAPDPLSRMMNSLETNLRRIDDLPIDEEQKASLRDQILAKFMAELGDQLI